MGGRRPDPLLQTYLFTGNGAVGKSLVELMRLVAHVLGKPWLGMPVMQGPAIYLGAEDDADELHRRLAAILKYYGATFADLAKGGMHLLSYVGEDCLLAVPDRSSIIRPTTLWARIEEATMDIRPVAISIDTVADAIRRERDRPRAGHRVCEDAARRGDAGEVFDRHPRAS